MSRGIMAWGPLIAITVIGAVLRVFLLEESLSADELWTYVGATQASLSGVLDFVQSDQEITPPLFTVLAWISAKLGDPTIWIRLPSLLAGLLTIPLTYALGLRTLRDRAGALLAATLAALSPFLIWYSSEARTYAVMVALALASTLSLLMALERQRSWGWWVAYSLFTCAAMYAHYTAVFVLAAQFAWAVLLHSEARRYVIAANVAAVVCFLPWTPGLLDDLESPTAAVYETLAPFEIESFVDFSARFAVGHPGIGLADLLGPIAEVALLLGIALAIGGAVAARRAPAARTGRSSARRQDLALVVALAAAAPVGAALASLVGQDLYLSRNLAVSWPGFGVALAALLTAGALPVRMIATTLVTGAFAFGAIQTLTEPTLERPNYRDAAALVDETTGSDDVVLDVNPLFVGTQGTSPVALTLDVHLDEPHVNVHYITPPDGREALRAATGQRLALAGTAPFVAGVRADLGLADKQPLVERTYDGVIPIAALVFDIPGDRPGSG